MDALRVRQAEEVGEQSRSEHAKREKVAQINAFRNESTVNIINNKYLSTPHLE